MIELKGKYNQDCKIFLNEVEEGAIELIHSILNHEVSQGVQVRIMPDTHVGKGIVIGFTMPMTTMVNPNYIGVDIGCSVTSHKLNKRLSNSDLPRLNKAIRKAVPMGKSILNKRAYNGWWIASYLEEVNANVVAFQVEWQKRFGESKTAICIDKAYLSALCQKVEVSESSFYYSVGTLGGGNHFIEVGASELDGSNYLTIHSGSRNFGNKVCKFHANKMRASDVFPAEYYTKFENITANTVPKSDIPAKLKDLQTEYRVTKKEYLLSGDDMYAYMLDMIIAQTYAEFNHRAMSRAIFEALGDDFVADDSIYSMHNFIDPTDWIIRKGAIRSYAGERMIIPFNMRDGILICEGKSNADWNWSAPHGAGRILARGQALRSLDINEFKKEMEGIYSTSVCKATLDESPMAYKDKNMIIDAIQDTAIVLDSIKPIMNIKGTV